LTITVTSLVAGPFTATGAEQTTAYGFKVFSEDEIEVYYGADSTVIDPADYTVERNTSVAGDALEGGSVTLDAGAVPAASSFYIRAVPEFIQDQSYSSSGTRLENLNEALDRGALRDIHMRGRIEVVEGINGNAADAAEAAASAEADRILAEAARAAAEAAGPYLAENVDWTPPQTGAVQQPASAVFRDWVSILRFIDPALHTNILNGASDVDLSAAFQSAVDSGESLIVPGNPGSRYLLDGRVQIRGDHQKVRGMGARLDLRGIDPTQNAIELLSTRRDSGGSTTRSKQEFSGFRLIGDDTSSYGSLIFIEEGTFFPKVTDIISEAGANKGYFGLLADAAIRVHGLADTYVNDVTLRDIELHAIQQGSVLGAWPERGLWIEGCIEGRVENVKLFYYKSPMQLGDAAGVSRGVQHMIFDQVQCEPTKPTDIADNQNGVLIYTLADSSFRGCKLDPGNGVGTAGCAAVRFGTGGKGTQNVDFTDCSFQGFGNVDYAVVAEAGSSAYGVTVKGGTIIDFALGRVQDKGASQLQIDFAPDVKYFRTVPRRRRLEARTTAFAGLSVASGPTSNTTTLAAFEDVFLPQGTPALASVDVSSNFNFLEPYRIAAEGSWRVKAYQQTGATRAIAAGKLNLRAFRPDEIVAQAEFPVDYADLASGAAAVSNYFVPGAKVGLPVVCEFYDGVGLNGVVLDAYAVADNSVDVVRANLHNAAVNLAAAGVLTISVIRPVFDYVAGVSFNIATVAAGARGTASVGVPGSVMGDALVAWYSHSQEGCLIKPRMSANGTIQFEIINRTGSTPVGDAGAVIYVGGYRKPTTI